MTKTRTAAPDSQTPLMQQYRQMKGRYPHALLFFRVGDFYEMFDEDAIRGSELLGIALTSRDKQRANPTPLCGVPAVAVTTYIAKLIRAGQSVAICEQVESAAPAPGSTGRPAQSGLMQREVVRVITPGTVLEPELLDSTQSSYLGAVASDESSIGLVWIDLSTGEGWSSIIDGADARQSVGELLTRWNAQEVVLPQPLSEHPAWRHALQGLHCVSRPTEQFDPDRGRRQLQRHFGVESLAAWGGSDEPSVLSAAGALLSYLEETQQQALSHLRALRPHHPEQFLAIDPLTQSHLELTERSMSTSARRAREGSLLGVIDRAQTAMGGRLMRHWLLHPLLDIEVINQRLDRVEALSNEYERRASLRGELAKINDLERIIGRISLKAANVRDLVQLKESITHLPAAWKLLSSGPTPLQSFTTEWDDLTDLAQRIDQTVVDSPPLSLTEGGLIKPGNHAELDELRDLSRNGKQFIAALESDERQRTGIDSLKVRYNQVFGYYIEISKSNLSRVPEHYHRKQTLVNAERFMTPELKELEAKVLGAEERICQLEYQLYEELRTHVAQEAPRVQRMAERLAEIDAIASLAEIAVSGRYQRPTLSDSLTLSITGGRHPVVEQAIGSHRFVPNDTLINDRDHQLLIITGPNMAGKSTYLRQIAHMVILAQMGSFVPAEAAEIGLVDGIFTRIGATDDLVGGRSTFMVEMDETATILNRSTPRSLVLLDEVGRGTSTYDGVSIAWAVADHLYRVIGARTLFATHYHELTGLTQQHQGIKVYRVAVREWNDEIIFLRTIVEGGSDRSYGIQVARLAGLPESVITTAKQILAKLEEQGTGSLQQIEVTSTAETAAQPSLFEPPLKQLAEELAALDPDNMTPILALEKLGKLREECRRVLGQ